MKKSERIEEMSDAGVVVDAADPAVEIKKQHDDWTAAPTATRNRVPWRNSE